MNDVEFLEYMFVIKNRSYSLSEALKRYAIDKFFKADIKYVEKLREKVNDIIIKELTKYANIKILKTEAAKQSS